jgi:hypothetical protein
VEWLCGRVVPAEATACSAPVASVLDLIGALLVALIVVIGVVALVRR